MPDSACGNWSARPQPGAHENILDIAPPYYLIVDVIAGSAVARERALDRDFRILPPGAASASVCVVEDQFHRGAAGRLAVRGTIENDVLHRFAAQLGSLGFAQDPAHRIDDIGFAATVRPHHPDQLARYLKMRRFNKRLES